MGVAKGWDLGRLVAEGLARAPERFQTGNAQHPHVRDHHAEFLGAENGQCRFAGIHRRGVEALTLEERREQAAAEVEERADVPRGNLVGQDGAGPIADERLGVVANDTDIDGNALSAVLVAGPAHGLFQRLGLLIGHAWIVWFAVRTLQDPDGFLGPAMVPRPASRPTLT